uniref:Uncharacterized protein n=1 Tax=Ditylum brightwellii TaxID=49249 RepID=A0A7S4RIL8_9STRA|mmetsp:Transcript_32808/g.43758  ORF Transcript_32808/g.43758 Transcript_32808/m.43758 type:complete len:233 (+) Transcript_32808:52-750(+)
MSTSLSAHNGCMSMFRKEYVPKVHAFIPSETKKVKRAVRKGKSYLQIEINDEELKNLSLSYQVSPNVKSSALLSTKVTTCTETKGRKNPIVVRAGNSPNQNDWEVIEIPCDNDEWDIVDSFETRPSYAYITQPDSAFTLIDNAGQFVVQQKVSPEKLQVKRSAPSKAQVVEVNAFTAIPSPEDEWFNAKQDGERTRNKKLKAKKDDNARRQKLAQNKKSIRSARAPEEADGQ